MVACGVSDDRSSRERLVAWLAALFLMLQLIVPIIVLGRNEISSRDFSWDMFSYQLSCDQLAIRVRVGGPQSPWQSVRVERELSSWAQLRRLLSEARFHTYAGQICRELQTQEAGSVELYVESSCRTDRAAPPAPILDPKRDFCRAR
jgi:hypothetical protein